MRDTSFFKTTKYLARSGSPRIDDTTIMPRGTAQINDVSTWLPPSLDTPWQNVFFEYIKKDTSTLNIKKKRRKRHNPFTFKLGDKVHISHLCSAFQREYDVKWSGEIFKIVKRFL